MNALLFPETRAISLLSGDMDHWCGAMIALQKFVTLTACIAHYENGERPTS